MGKCEYKYGDKFFKNHLGIARNCQKHFIDYSIDHSFVTSTIVDYIEDWIQRFEEMKELIENVNVESKYQKCFNKRCAKLTEEMGILTNAQQILYKFILTSHQNS